MATVLTLHAWLKRRTAALNLRNLASRGLTPPRRRPDPGYLTRRPHDTSPGQDPPPTARDGRHGPPEEPDLS
jgi:hypothetical protein